MIAAAANLFNCSTCSTIMESVLNKNDFWNLNLKSKEDLRLCFVNAVKSEEECAVRQTPYECLFWIRRLATIELIIDESDDCVYALCRYNNYDWFGYERKSELNLKVNISKV